MAKNPQIDRFVQDAENRADAARQLRDIFDTYPDLFEQFVQSCSRNGSHRATKSATGKKPSIAKLVYDYVFKHPSATAAEIVAELADRVETKMDSPKKAIYASLATLKRHKKLLAEADDDGAQRYTALVK